MKPWERRLTDWLAEDEVRTFALVGEILHDGVVSYTGEISWNWEDHARIRGATIEEVVTGCLDVVPV